MPSEDPNAGETTMKTTAILTLVLATASLHAKGFVPSPTAEEPRARVGQQMKIEDVKVTVRIDPTKIVDIFATPEVPLTGISLDRSFLDSPPGNLVRAELEAANGEND